MTTAKRSVAESTRFATPASPDAVPRGRTDKRSSHNGQTSANIVRHRPTGWRIGYARVSSTGQNLDRQSDALEGVDVMHTDKASGGLRAGRPGLEAVLASLRAGDIVVVKSLDRLARSVRDALDIVDELERRRAHLQILDLAVDTTTPMGRFMLQLFAAVAELERGQIRVRQAEGIAAAKQRGTHLGRPVSLSPDQVQAVRDLRAGGASYRTLAATFGVSTRTIERAVKH